MEMRPLKDAVWLVTLGAGLIAYAHANFATKSNLASIFTMLQSLTTRISHIEKKTYEIHGILRSRND